MKYFSLLTVVINLILLSACASEQRPIQKINDKETENNSAYIYNWGRASTDDPSFDTPDFANIEFINDISIDLEKHFATQIPAGENKLKIKHVEISGAWIITPYMRWERSSHMLILNAEKSHVYAPFIDDRCNQLWVWIEDWGLVSKTTPLNEWHPVYSSLEKPVTAGTAPPEMCESSVVEPPTISF